MRSQVNSIVIYSQGSFTLQELYKMPMHYVREIEEALIEKNEKEKQALDQAKGKNRQTF